MKQLEKLNFPLSKGDIIAICFNNRIEKCVFIEYDEVNRLHYYTLKSFWYVLDNIRHGNFYGNMKNFPLQYVYRGKLLSYYQKRVVKVDMNTLSDEELESIGFAKTLINIP